MTLIVLIGPPGAGKSTVGTLLASALGVPFVDTDAMVEQDAGSSIADLFVEHGEPHFRALEQAAVARALDGDDAVVALGGGAPMAAASDRLLGSLGSRARVVFLDVGLADAAGRVGFDTARPLLAINPRATWVRLMAERRATYERLADLRVDTGGRGPEQVATEILDDVGPWT